jgi:cytochrome c-type biogenesis protein CcmH
MSDSPAASELDISAVKSQLNQLKELHDAGTLTAQAYAEARSALERRVLDWVLRDQTPGELDAIVPAKLASQAGELGARTPAEGGSPAKATNLTSAVLAGGAALALLAGGAYLWSVRAPHASPTSVISGSTKLLSPPVAPGSQAPHANQAGDISVMAEKLAARLKKEPGDVQGWAILARSYVVLGNQAEALVAFEKALKLQPNDGVLLADYAEALAATGKVGASGVTSTSSLNVVAPKVAASVKTVSGTVTLAASLLKSTRPDDTVFIVARPQEGSRMPLALLRKQVKDLPFQFTLDDSMGMSPAVKLSTAGKVVVSVRISKTGSPAPEKGDLGGQSEPISVGTKSLVIEISGPVKP